MANGVFMAWRLVITEPLGLARSIRQDIIRQWGWGLFSSVAPFDPHALLGRHSTATDA